MVIILYFTEYETDFMISRDLTIRHDPYLSTCSGKQFCLQAPDSSLIDIEDIARGLAYQCCYIGQTNFYYSLAQHSLLVATLVPPMYRLAALLHEAAAVYFGDMAGALRQLLPEFASIETRTMMAIGEKFSVSGFDAPAIKRAHLIAQATEHRDLRPTIEMHNSPACPVPVPRRIEFMSPEEAKYQFSEFFAELVRKAAPEKSGSAGNRGARLPQGRIHTKKSALIAGA